MGACHQRPNGLSWPVPETPFSKMGDKAGSRLSANTRRACPLYGDALFMQLPAVVAQRACSCQGERAHRLLQQQPQKAQMLPSLAPWSSMQHGPRICPLTFDLAGQRSETHAGGTRAHVANIGSCWILHHSMPQTCWSRDLADASARHACSKVRLFFLGSNTLPHCLLRLRLCS